MSYIDLINEFWKKDAERSFTPMETRLYLRMLHECNRRNWLNPFELSAREMEKIMGKSGRYLRDVRKGLQDRGIIEFSGGKNRPITILLKGQKITNPKHQKTAEKDHFEDAQYGTILPYKRNYTSVLDPSKGNYTSVYTELYFPLYGTIPPYCAPDTYFNNIKTIKDNKDEEEYKEEKSSSSASEISVEKVSKNKAEISPLKTEQKNSKPKVFEEVEKLLESEIWISSACAVHHLPEEEIRKRLKEFSEHCVIEGVEEHKDDRDLKSHFSNWLRLKRKKRNEDKRQDKFSERRGTEPGTESRQGFKGTF